MPSSRRAAESCDPGKRGRLLSVGRVAGGGIGLLLLVLGALVAPGIVALGPALIATGGAVLLFAVALPLANQVEVGAPLLGKVVFDADRRRKETRELVQDLRELVVVSAEFLCTDEESAKRAVEASLAEAVLYWRGADRWAFRGYLMCVLVHQARFEALTSGRRPPASHPGSDLTQLEREVLLLVGRVGLSSAEVAAVVGTTVDDVERVMSRAMAALDGRRP